MAPRGVAKLGIALGLGPRGRWFKSGRPDFAPLLGYAARALGTSRSRPGRNGITARLT